MNPPESFLDVQKKIYEGTYYDTPPPPMLPHGDDPAAIPSRNAPRRRHKTKKSKSGMPLPVRPNASKEEEVLLPASDLPQGFPPELTFRALAAYATVRTLSIELRVSPFTPNVFLRALYLPFPNRLLGRLHTAILRILLCNLQMGYHWNESKPAVDVCKKRKRDAIRWPLRAGDNLRYLDTYTWPVFYDDYCHLTADLLHASWNSSTDYVDLRTLDVSGMNANTTNERPSSWQEYGASRTQGWHQAEDKNRNRLSVLYVEEDDDDDEGGNNNSDEEFRVEANDEPTDDDDDDYIMERRPRKKRRRAAKKPANPHAAPLHQTPPIAPPGFQIPYYNVAAQRQAVAQPYFPINFPLTHSRRTMLPGYNPVSSAQAQTVPQVVRRAAAQLPPNISQTAHERARSFALGGHGVQRNSMKPNAGATTAAVQNKLPTEYRLPQVIGKSASAPIATVGSATISVPVKQRRLATNKLPLQPKAVGAVTVTAAQNPVSSNQRPKKMKNPAPCHQHTETPKKPSPQSRPRSAASTNSSSSSKSCVVEGSVFVIKSPAERSPFYENSQIDTNVGGKTETASQVEAFIQGKNKESHPGQLNREAKNEEEKCDGGAFSCPPEKLEKQRWPQFGPLSKMRSGVPYHQLSVEEKLVILEFLVDELLSIDTIAALFSRRQAVTSCFPLPYGQLPTKSELQHLENEDECAVCRREGDLICCDGCTSSYHNECLGLPREGSLPEGDWLCPECDLKDPAALGPLRGGRKSALDWFTVADLEKSVRMSSEMHVASVEGHESDDSTSEFLVVHGFVFRRNQRADRDDDAGRAFLPLNTAQLQNELALFGPKLCTCWPLDQIPLSVPMLFKDPSLATKALYFRSLDKFDPSYYDNRYRRAPLPRLVKKVNDSHMMDYELRCRYAEARNLSAVLAPEMVNDAAVVESLRSSTILFDANRLISEFLIRVENELSKASLLDEFWGTKDTAAGAGVWTTAVKGCQSVRRLSELTLQLVDATHHRAFLDGWFQSATTKPKESSSEGAPLERKVTLPEGFGLKDESLRRHWDRSPMCTIPAVAAKSSKSLGRWIREMRPDLGTKIMRNGKRKQSHEVHGQPIRARENSGGSAAGQKLEHVVQPSAKKTSQDGLDRDNDGSSTTDTANNLVQSRDEDPTKKLRNRRRPERVDGTLNEAINSSLVSSPSARLDPHLNIQKLKISQLEMQLKAPAIAELHWPFAGRKLFPPLGCLPKLTTKHLARNAGSVRAPFVTYSPIHEVGQLAHMHIWRKRVSVCKSFEELLMLLRHLEAFLDHSVIRKCTGISQRFKGSKGLAVEILWTQRDLRTGVDYHFVGKRGEPTGKWSSSIDIDLGQLCLERSRRRKFRLDAMAERLLARKNKVTSNTTSVVTSQEQLDADKVLENHKKETKAFIKKYGAAAIPPGQLESLRVTTTAKLTSIYTLKRIPRTDALISAEITKAEVDAGKSESDSAKPTDRYPLPAGADSVSKSAHATRSHSSGQEIAANALVSTNRLLLEAVRDPSSLQEQTKSSQQPPVSTSAPFASGKSQAGAANQVLADHSIGMKNLIGKHGTALIPLGEFDALRQRNESRLAVAMQETGANAGKKEVDAMFTQVEIEVQRQMNENRGKLQQSNNLKSTPRVQADSLAPRLTATEQRKANRSSDYSQLQLQTTKLSSGASGSNGMSTIEHNHAQAMPPYVQGATRRPQSSQNQTVSQNARHFAQNAQFNNRSQRWPPNSGRIASQQQDFQTSRSFYAASAQPVGKAPMHLTDQAIAQHKAATRELIRQHNGTFPEYQLQPAREICKSQLSSALQMYGVAFPDEKLTAVMLEIETEVLKEEFAKRQQPPQLSTSALFGPPILHGMRGGYGSMISTVTQENLGSFWSQAPYQQQRPRHDQSQQQMLPQLLQRQRQEQPQQHHVQQAQGFSSGMNDEATVNALLLSQLTGQNLVGDVEIGSRNPQQGRAFTLNQFNNSGAGQGTHQSFQGGNALHGGSSSYLQHQQSNTNNNGMQESYGNGQPPLQQPRNNAFGNSNAQPQNHPQPPYY